MITERKSNNLISLSIAPAIVTTGKKYYDLSASIELMQNLQQMHIVDGFEFQLLEEWDDTNPPIDEQDKRFDSWEDSPKYSIDDIAALIKGAKCNILSVHAKRDVGKYLCSSDSSYIDKGKHLVEEALKFTKEIGCHICVFHIWDTWKDDSDIRFLHYTLSEISLKYPTVKASVENVPTHVNGCTPFDLVKHFQWITLDLQWAALYDELNKFEEVKNKIVNVHLRGKLDDSRWTLDNSPFKFYDALNMLRDEWGYKGILTMEPNQLTNGQLSELTSAMSSL